MGEQLGERCTLAGGGEVKCPNCGSELTETLIRRAHGDEDLHKYIECPNCPYEEWEVERKEK